jgi:hypothetical protein
MNDTTYLNTGAEPSAETNHQNHSASAVAQDTQPATDGSDTQATESGGLVHNSTEVAETPDTAHGFTRNTRDIRGVAVINDLSAFPLSVRALAAPKRRRHIRHFGPPRMIHGVPFFESRAALDSAKSSKWAVNLTAHCHHAGQLPSATPRTVQVGILVGETVTLVTGHIRPRTFAAFFYRAQLEELGITKGVGFLATLVKVEGGTPVIPPPVIPAHAEASAQETKGLAMEKETVLEPENEESALSLTE